MLVVEKGKKSRCSKVAAAACTLHELQDILPLKNTQTIISEWVCTGHSHGVYAISDYWNESNASLTYLKYSGGIKCSMMKTRHQNASSSCMNRSAIATIRLKPWKKRNQKYVYPCKLFSWGLRMGQKLRVTSRLHFKSHWIALPPMFLTFSVHRVPTFFQSQSTWILRLAIQNPLLSAYVETIPWGNIFRCIL